MAGRRWVLGVTCGLAAAVTASAADWPQWRGPTRDNKATDFKVPATWPKELKRQWKEPVGEGEACPVMAGDRVYTFTRVGGDEVITCLNADTGKDVWKEKYATEFRGTADAGHPGPRATPALGDGMIVTFGVNGNVYCFDAKTGKKAWETKAKSIPGFHTSASPLIVDGMVILYLGGDKKGEKAELTAFNLKTGDVKWTWAEQGVKYGSPVLATIAGTKQVVTLTATSLVGVSVDEGKLLWEIPYASRYNSTTPVVDGDTVYVSGQGPGTVAVKVEKSGEKFAAKELWHKNPFSTNYDTPLLKDGLLYVLAAGGGGGRGRGGELFIGLGSGQGGGQPPGGQRRGGGGMGGGPGSATLSCLDAKTGETKWTDPTPVGDCGGVFDAGSVLLAVTNKSELLVFKPNDKAYTEVAKYKVADSPVWALPILTGNRVYVKDKDSLILWTLE